MVIPVSHLNLKALLWDDAVISDASIHELYPVKYVTKTGTASGKMGDHLL